jgi:hypothetical protein
MDNTQEHVNKFQVNPMNKKLPKSTSKIVLTILKKIKNIGFNFLKRFENDIFQ